MVVTVSKSDEAEPSDGDRGDELSPTPGDADAFAARTLGWNVCKRIIPTIIALIDYAVILNSSLAAQCARLTVKTNKTT